MVSVDTDKLIRDEASLLVRALVGDLDFVAKEHPRPDLHAVELLDAVIEELQRHRERRLQPNEQPAVRPRGPNVIDLPEVGR